MRRLPLLLCLSFLIPAARAQDITSLSVEEAIDYALLHQADIKNIRLDEAISKARNAEVTGLALPQVSASGQFQYYFDPQKSFLPGEFFGAPAGTFIPITFTPKFNNQASATLNQTLFDGTVVVALQARKTLEELARINVTRSEEELKAAITKAYYNIVVVQKQLNLLNQTHQDVLQIAKETEIAYKTGVAEKIAVDQAKVQANNIQTRKTNFQNIIEISVYALKFQMGMPLQNPIALEDTVVENLVSMGDVTLDENFDYNRSSLYRLAQTDVTLKELDLKRYRWEGLPRLSAFGSYGFNYANNEFSKMFTEEYLKFGYAGLQLNVPIFDGLQRRNRVKQARFALEKSRNSFTQAKQSIDLDQQQSRTTLKNNLITLENQRANVELAQSVFDLAQKKYKAGVGSNIEIVQAETSLLEAQSAYFDALNAAISAKTDLQKALGYFQ